MNTSCLRTLRTWLWIAGIGSGLKVTAAEAVEAPGPMLEGLTPEEERLLDEALRATAATPSFWPFSGSVRTAGGYRDNVLLSAFAPVSAPVYSIGADFILNRIPTDGTEVTLFATGDYTLFVDAPEADPEILALVQAELKRRVSDSTTLGIEGSYVFLQQVFDVSATEATLSTVTAVGSTLAVTPSAEVKLGEHWQFVLEAEGTRQIFSQPLDDYWEAEPSVALVRGFASGAELSLRYTFGRRWYETRIPLDEDGDPTSGVLRFNAHELELRSTVYLDAAQRWRTQVRVGWLDNRDNGGGYFDFRRYAAGMQVRYRAGPWTVRAEARGRWYDYPVQRSEGPDTSLRQKTDLTALLRGEFQASRRLRLFVQYEHESSWDTAPGSSYDANALVVGVEFDL